ncbi:Peptidase S1 and S6 chymotrypsin/Hap [Nostocoides japonicum T1-X7]|uniref:Peptidase S1 and S6 chymotrypsin/Hap n=1 Tax=Nostocoides japonicum T1-X7 TaxID=1194083 RepID=A0A077M4U8_9MICO|nr:MarP family serine protease [Tetrasphaera japonica]CCH79124.1 Peptidase S1 and S6 chymotrypsin/Hap [Tetrasphaera japonica T1-X7]
MSPGTWLDVALVLLLLAYGISGWRQGLVVSVMSLAGFLGGGALAMAVLPVILDRLTIFDDNQLWRSIFVVLVVFVGASIGQSIMVAIGYRIRSVVRLRSAQVVDSFLGVVVVVAATAVLMWFVAGAVRGGAPPTVSRAIGQSWVLRTIDEAVPPRTDELFSSLREALDREGFPRVFAGIRAEPIRPVNPPDPSVVDAGAVARAAQSVIKITGVSDGCQQGQEGSGWVVARDRVVTNAHVVAGVDHLTVRPQGTGRTYSGQVVVFDPERDLAVIDVPGLPAAPLELGSPLSRGDSAVVAGFPLNGPYDLEAARVRQVLRADGADIYGNPGIIRQIYSLYAVVRSGNSGGPLLDPQGRVAGIVFARSLDDASTGYALTLQEAAPVLRKAASASTPVSTGSCIRD